MKNLILFLLVLTFSFQSFAKINARFVRAIPLRMEIVKGNIPGHAVVDVISQNPAVGTSFETVWPEGGLVVFPSSSSTMTVSSDDADDTSAGAGLRTVLINGLNAGVSLSETIILNGLTPVTTVNSYDRINRMRGLTAGASAVNEGHIYIGTGTVTAGKPAVVVNLIDATDNISTSGFFTLPNNISAFVSEVLTSAEGNKSVVLRDYMRKPGELFNVVSSFNLFNAVMVATSMLPPEILPPGTDIEFRAKSVVGSADVNISCVLVLIDDSAL